MLRNFLFLFFIVFYCNASAQIKSDSIMKSINLDSVMIISKAGLSQEDFINAIKTDTIFYRAFQEMKLYSFFANNQIVTYDKKGKVESTIFRKIFHNNTGKKYKQEVLEAKESGKIFKKNGKYELYTVKMFFYIFMNENNSDFVAPEQNFTNNTTKGKTDEGYKEKLKTLIFRPGTKIDGIPLIGNKTRLFDEDLKKYYDFTYNYATYLDRIPVYYFRCKIKPELSNNRQDDLMIKDLTTIFDANNFKILGRSISMQYDGLPFDFDVTMNIELDYFGEELLPIKIGYKGSWDIPFKKAENCSFDIVHSDYRKK